mmetsp:Transcript_10906/g.35873  ORF Transcript_10906/g.35873 Transcript_10906/m.35873 type:complete len:109 (-) Transcript_10906:125-451(-)
MVMYESGHFDEFFRAAVALYRNDPLKTRYVNKYRHCDGKLELKVTDDRTCLKFRTDQQADLRRMEKLTTFLMTVMAKGLDAESELEQEGAQGPPAVPAPAPKKRGRRS